ncbi:MAG: sulfatase [Candidatus Sumerlaeia bacterium]
MPKKPNFLFLLPDQHRPDWLGVNPDLPLSTPNMDRVIHKGVRFTNAYTPSPLCSPARACLATGREYHRCGVIDNGQNTPLSLPTYYQKLRDCGYEVAGVGKFDLHKPDHDWGLDGSKMLPEYGFTCGIDNEGKGDAISAYKQNDNSPRGPYMQFLVEKGLVDRHLAMYDKWMKSNIGWLNFPDVTTLPDEAYCDNWVAQNAMDCLENFPADKPWHLVVNFVGPHGPFDVTQSMRDKWKNIDVPDPVDSEEPDQETIRERRQNYGAMIENIDHHIGRMIDLIDKRGELDNTIIIYSSDHGEMLGDHDRWAKNVWYTPSAGIPMFLAGPGIREGVELDTPVALHDLAATMLDYADAEALPDSDAKSLRPVLEGESDSHRDFVLSSLKGRKKWDMIFDGRYKLVIVENEENKEILYDLQEDPSEMENVASANPELVNDLKAKLRDARQNAWSPA